MPVIPLNGAKSSFQLDTSGVAAFFGGEEAISAMSSVNTFQGPWRRWFGWYNSPGSYVLARKFGQLAGSRFWDGLFPGVDVDPAELFGLAGDKGPEFAGAKSGSYIADTGQIASLLLKECQAINSETGKKKPATVWEAFRRVCADLGMAPVLPPASEESTKKIAKQTENRSPVTITIVDLHKIQVLPEVTENARVPPDWTCYLAFIPILSSTAGSIVCGIYRDWYCFSMILLGMLANGVACVVLGGAKFEFKHHKPAPNCPEGDGVLFSQTGRDFVVVLGEEEAVSLVTKGHFGLEFSGEPEYRQIGLAAMLLVIQTLVQLLLIPQGELFGQIMFLGTLAVSWAYNCFLSSLDKYKIQRRVLVDNMLKLYTLSRTLQQYKLGSRTAAVAFLLMYLLPVDSTTLLDRLLPNNTATWKKWKEVLLRKLENDEDFTFEQPGDYGDLGRKEKALLLTFYNDAQNAYKALH